MTGDYPSNPHVEPPCGRTLRVGCILVALLTPLKLSLTYIVLIPIILIWIFSSSQRCGLLGYTTRERSITAPLAFLLLAITVSAITGLDPRHSLSPLLSLLFFAFAIPVFRDYGDRRFVPLALITGQAIAAFHTVVASALPGQIPSTFLGSVTESGQLSLSIFTCLGLIWHEYTNTESRTPLPLQRGVFVSCGAALILFSALGFRDAASIPLSTLCAIWGTGLLLMTGVLRPRYLRTPSARGLAILTTIYAPLLLSALLLNLKRGPWLGVVLGAAVFCGIYARKLCAVLIAAALFTAVTVPPVRDRLAASYEHFTISGGRSTIWKIGSELISDYPLGIGYHNSGILRQFSLEIPPELKHFHNNLLNIAAESGLLTAAIFAWFIVAVVRGALSAPRSSMRVGIACAFISWQAAGLVEYNFGDSEVMIIAWMLLGLLLSDLRRESSGEKVATSPTPSP